jgi:oligoribonuclease (3'-5' exoribonuclease)
VSDNLVQSVDQNISELSCEYPKISCTVLYEIIAVTLVSHNCCARWVPKMVTGVNKTQRMASALIF